MTRKHLHAVLATLAATVGAGALAGPAEAVRLVALTSDAQLLRFDSASPGSATRVRITSADGVHLAHPPTEIDTQEDGTGRTWIAGPGGRVAYRVDPRTGVVVPGSARTVAPTTLPHAARIGLTVTEGAAGPRFEVNTPEGTYREGVLVPETYADSGATATIAEAEVGPIGSEFALDVANDAILNRGGFPPGWVGFGSAPVDLGRDAGFELTSGPEPGRHDMWLAVKEPSPTLRIGTPTTQAALYGRTFFGSWARVGAITAPRQVLGTASTGDVLGLTEDPGPA